MSKKGFIITAFAVFSLFAQAQEVTKSTTTVPKVVKVHKDKVAEVVAEVKPKIEDIKPISTPPITLPESVVSEKIKEVVPPIEVVKDDVSIPKGINEAIKTDNELIRDVLMRFSTSINQNDDKLLMSVTKEQLFVIDSSQQISNSKLKVEEYFPKIINGDNIKLERKEYFFEPGYIVEINGDNATAYGRSIEKYSVGDVSHELKGRWTANISNDSTGWKIKSFHSGVNFSYNSILTSYSALAGKVGLLGIFIGLIIGLMFGFILTRVMKK